MRIRDVRCIDGLADSALDHVDIVIADGRIQAVEAHDPTRPAEPDDVDGRGRRSQRTTRAGSGRPTNASSTAPAGRSCPA